MGAALGTQVVRTLRCALENGLAFGLFLVEQTQRVRFQAPLALLAQPGQVLAEVLGEPGNVRGPTHAVADAVDLQAEVAQAERGI